MLIGGLVASAEDEGDGTALIWYGRIISDVAHGYLAPAYNGDTPSKSSFAHRSTAMNRLSIFILCLSWICADSGALAEDSKQATFSAEQIEFFERKVRPVLLDRCLQCHGPEEQEVGLRLDSREAVTRGSIDRPVVNLQRPGDSLLIQAIRYDSDLQMPPTKRLADDEVAALVRWVEMGLPWPAGEPVLTDKSSDAWKQHWAFQPVSRPPLPTAQRQDWPQSSIDRFVLAKLDDAKLASSAPVERRALLRRLTFDLTGLPPTADQIGELMSDSSPDAFERLVDRLLASPRYGERWGRHWLDIARYADNKGYTFFGEKKFPWSYTYRDYVVQAFNEDLPYDQFLLQQLAADQLDLGGDPRPLAAMGFLTIGGQFMDNTHDIIDDRIDVVCRGLMALTVTCARCHDHKYDPIPQADYYSLYGVFRSGYQPVVPPLATKPPATGEYRKFAAEMESREKKLIDFVTQKHRELVDGARMRVAEYLGAVHDRKGQPPTDDFMLLTDKGALNPGMVLRWQVYLEQHAADHPVWAPWHAFANLSEEQFSQQSPDVLRKLLNNGKQSINSMVAASLVSPPNSIDDLARRYGELFKSIESEWQQFIKDAESAGLATPQRMADSHEEQLRQELYGPGAPPNVPVILGWGFLTLFPDRPTQAEYKKHLKDVQDWMAKAPDAPPRAMVLLDSDSPHDPRIFLRGNASRLGDAVPRQFIGFLQAKKIPIENGSGRLEMAREIADARNPLTARVLVNRVWMYHFGQGLVSTPSDFGLRSDPPSHPLLLDHLASEFTSGGWSIKQLHRKILTASVYRQESHDRPSCAAVDPENRLLWKMNRRRLDFESLRDSLLAVGHCSDHQVGGPPSDIFSTKLNSRRTIYGFVDRMDVQPVLTTFGFPNPVATSAKREATTVPPQALYWMNHSFLTEVAKRISTRADIKQLGPEQRIAGLYGLLFGRTPTDDERLFANNYLGSNPTTEQQVSYIHALLMTNEFVFVD